MDIKIEKVTYNNPKHRKILKVVLSKWFINPKELNWTDPRINYPFNFNKWVELTYKNPKVNSFVLNKNKLIVGMGNIIFNKQTKYAHALHIFIAPECRNNGFATKILKYFETIAKNEKMEKITVNVMPKNLPAIKLYKKLGFQKIKSNEIQWMQFQKSLV